MYKKFYWWQQQQHTSNGKNYIYFGKGRHTPNLEPNLKIKKNKKKKMRKQLSLVKVQWSNWLMVIGLWREKLPFGSGFYSEVYL